MAEMEKKRQKAIHFFKEVLKFRQMQKLNRAAPHFGKKN